MASTIVILDPRGELTAETHLLSRRLDGLRGKRVGIIDNSMPASKDILRVLGELLVSEAGVQEVVLRVKPTVSRPAPAEIVAEMLKCDAVVCGVGV